MSEAKALSYHYDRDEDILYEENKIENVMEKYDLVMDERGFLRRKDGNP